MNLDAGCKNIRNDNNDDDEPDFMDNSGKCWEFASKIRDEKHLKEWCQNKMGGMIVGKEEKLTRQFHCPNKECQFKAIFLKSCSNVYTRNQHNHDLEKAKNMMKMEKKKTPKNIGNDYVDRFGNIWKFDKEIGKNAKREIFLNKFGFGTISTNVSGFHLRCGKKGFNGKCSYAGIYLNSNGFLYTRGKHEHEHIEKNPNPNVGDAFVDKFGKIWPFHAKIGRKHIPNGIWNKKYGFTTIVRSERTLNLKCQRTNPADGRCPIRGIYVYSNGCLYIRGKHAHKNN